MIEKVNVIETVIERLKKLPEGHALDLRTYKRNRSVVIVREAGGMLRLIQNGYEKAEYEIPETKLKKLLKALLRKEFPRSTKVRLYTLGEFSPELADVKRKKI